MRVDVDVKALAHAVKEARSFIPAVPDNPVTGSLSIRCNDGRLTLVGQGPRGEVEVEVALEGDCEPGELLMPPKPLEQLLKALPRGTVRLSSDERGDLEVVGEGSAQGYRLRSVPGAHPPLPYRFSTVVNVPPQRLAAAVAAVRRSAGGDDNAAQLRVSGGLVVVESTDNYRLSRAEIRTGGDVEASAVLRHADLEAAAKAGCSDLAFDGSSMAVRASGGGQSRVIRALDRPFPPTDSLVRRPAPHSVTVEVDGLAAALRRLEAVTQGGPVNVTFGSGVMLLSGENPDVGYGTESIPAEGGDQEMALLVRSEYLLDVAETETGYVRIMYADASSAVRFEGEAGTVHVVMPLRRA